jgi:hypothetical protein
MLRVFRRLLGMACIAVAILPVPALATTFSTITLGQGYLNGGDSLQVIGLGSDGYAYVPVWQGGGPWYTHGILPGQSTQFQQLVAARGSNATLQVIGLGTNGLPYVAAYQASTGIWYAGGSIPSDGTHYTQLAVMHGGCGSAPLQLLGVGTDGHVHLVADQDTAGTWHSASGILGGNATYTRLTLGLGNQWTIQVFAEDPTAHPYFIGWQSSSTCAWTSDSALINGTMSGGPVVTANGNHGNLQVLWMPTGWSTPHIGYDAFLLQWQDSSGNWYPTGDGGWLSTCPAPGYGQLAGAQGNNTYLQLWTLSSSSYAQLICYQDGSGTWHSVGSIPTYNAQIKNLVMGNGNGGNIQVIGLGYDGDIELIAWQNNGTGTWTAGQDLTLTATTYPGVIGGGGGGGGGGCPGTASTGNVAAKRDINKCP